MINMGSTLLDPTGERSRAERQPLPRPGSLDGLTVGIVDISKPRGDVFLDQLDADLRARGIAVRRYVKPTFARPAPTSLAQKIATECQVVVVGLADCGSCTSCTTHDVVDLEGRGIPAVGIVSSEFAAAWAAQSKSLGMQTPVVFIQHPIADRTDDEMRGLADDALYRILRALQTEEMAVA